MENFPRNQQPKYISHSKRFVVERPKYSAQFFHVYMKRSQTLRPELEKAANQKWNCSNLGIPIRSKVLDSKEGETCVVIGEVYKEMSQKPCVLDDLSKELSLSPLIPQHKYTSANDSLILEDESGRIVLKGVIDSSISTLITGISVACLGSSTASGEFKVEDFVLSGIPNQSPLHSILSVSNSNSNDNYLAIISGLNFGKNNSTSLLELSLLNDFLTGYLNEEKYSKLASSIVRVVIAGNTFSSQSSGNNNNNSSSASGSVTTTSTSTTNNENNSKNINTAQKKITSSTNQSESKIKTISGQIDNWISELVLSGLIVDCMSGDEDPGNKLYPQQPLHPSLFPISSKYENFKCVTNPYDFQIDDVRLLGTSGQPTTNVMRYTNCDDPLVVLEQDLNSRHIAPTAPDTLSCFPFSNEDPFLVSECPHVYFAANQSKFLTKLIKEGKEGENQKTVRLISIPSFSESKEIVLLNLSNLDCHTISFTCMM